MKAKISRSQISQYVPAESRFWNRVNKQGPIHPSLKTRCWLWEGGVNNGYGSLMVNTRIERAHCYSWRIANGEIPIGLNLCHKCDNPLCVNPSHLFLGTHSDNRLDCVRKDRQAKGIRIGTAKLNEELVREIRKRYVRGCFVNGSAALAREYGIKQPAMHDVCTGRSWKHVKERM